jgi:hypothetical protein
MLFLLAKNIGYTIEGVGGFQSESNFAEKQKKAWEFCKKKIDRSLPCYGWELDEAEYYVINGYDDEGYCFSGPSVGSGEGTKEWQELGDTAIGQLAVFSIKPRQAAEDTKTIKESIECVLYHAKNPKEWIFPKYKAGLEGFDNWIHALETGTAMKMGMAYNAGCWAECRGFGVQFLKEAKERINGKTGSLFNEAAEHYEAVHENLQKVSELFPLPLNRSTDTITDSELSQTAIKHLRDARKAEEAGLKMLEKIYSEL